MTSPHFHSRPDCPACGTRGNQSFSRDYDDSRLRHALIAFYAEVGALDYRALAGATYSVAACPSCGTWFQTVIPSDPLLAQLYEEWIDPAKARLRYHHDQPFHHFLASAREVHLALSLAGPHAPRTALDYGCGWGEWGRLTQAFGCETWGTELSPTRRDHALRHGIRIVDDVDLPDAYFGQINLDQVLEHLPAPRACLGMLAAKLHPAGSLRLAVPHARRVSRALRNFDRELTRPRLGGLNAIAPLEHLNAFTTAGLVRLAAACGLERTAPPWSKLMAALVFPPGAADKFKTLLRPFYLRSAYSTQLYFRHSIR